MISERTLRSWRRESLRRKRTYQHFTHTAPVTGAPEEYNIASLTEQELNERILRLTQELLDVHLLR